MTYSFNEKCIDCELCAKHCSAGAIIVHRENEHIRCEVDTDLCVSCGHCGNICEKGAVIDNTGKQARHLPKSKWKSPSIDLGRCTGCMLCVETCPEFALAISTFTSSMVSCIPRLIMSLIQFLILFFILLPLKTLLLCVT